MATIFTTTTSTPKLMILLIKTAPSITNLILEQPAGVESGEGGWFSHVMYMVTSIS